MKILFLIFIFTFVLNAQKILVINSNPEVQRYAKAVEEFSKNFDKPFTSLDISNMSNNHIKEYLYDEYPDIIYAVGIKAYQYANKYIPEKEIYFSSIINWKRLAMDDNRLGVSNELHSGMQLTLIKSIFHSIKTIGVIYSEYTQDAVNDFSKNATILGIKIALIKVDKDSINDVNFDDFIQESEAIMIISDPVFLNNDKSVESLFRLGKKYKKPIFAYHHLFIEYGAILAISADNSTVGRQIATMIENNIDEVCVHKVQYPAGTSVVFNKKEATELGIEFSKNITSTTTKIIE